jgi:hypothetical protein
MFSVMSLCAKMFYSSSAAPIRQLLKVLLTWVKKQNITQYVARLIFFILVLY